MTIRNYGTWWCSHWNYYGICGFSYQRALIRSGVTVSSTMVPNSTYTFDCISGTFGITHESVYGSDVAYSMVCPLSPERDRMRVVVGVTSSIPRRWWWSSLVLVQRLVLVPGLGLGLGVWQGVNSVSINLSNFTLH